ncbi:NfeD family protein [Paractinoplanes atraurantiacus]|uniref:Membrane protein implicated in regulation of membrane protease activity n=1 Tax=Paractinoplanes atraurantiacus TaxID=1036182 RepID=A0A285GSS4_9ACTN|nr:NfeD family protein [Actinoplanes atraurantiacus]SNY25556.1 Membrane protein implicated in regulation of membrane protease activity [Actinoplanes atraurantiacus]
MDVVLWVILAVVLAVAEIFTTTLFLLMFSIGAGAAAGAAALGAPMPVQAGVFVGVSALTLVAGRPALRRRFGKDDPADLVLPPMLGASALVVEQVGAGAGMVKVDGELWQARSLEGSGGYLPGERVRIVEVDGGVAVVWRDDLPGLGERRLQPE